MMTCPDRDTAGRPKPPEPQVPLVSVVIPTHDRPRHLEKAVKSVKKQQGVPLQIIIVDDASTLDLSETYQKQDGVFYLRNPENRGGAYSRNRGLEMAEGKYIQFLDDDDELLPGKLEKQLSQFERTDLSALGMVSCHILDRRSGSEKILWNRFRGNIYRLSLKKYTVQLTSSMLFVTQAVRQIGGFDPELPSSQEYDLVIRLSRHFNVDFVDEVLAVANRSENQISMNFEKKRIGAERLFEKYDHEYRKQGFLFWLSMRIKLHVLKLRFLMGKWMGESVYRIFTR